MDHSIEFSAHASLVALGVRFQQLGIWSLVRAHVKIKQKVRRHTPLDKLLDCFINLLAGGQGVVEVNTRVRPDHALPQAFGRAACAEQSTISDTLDACTPENVEQLRSALTAILRQHGQAYRPDYQQTWQLLDVDMTGLPAGRQGEGVTKGYFSKQPNRRGRQLGRVRATRYEEIVVDRLYDGQRQWQRSLKELLTAAEAVLELAENKRQSTVVRVDAGGGEDDDINWVLSRDYYLLAKVKSWRRAETQSVVASVRTWWPDLKVPEREVGWVSEPHAYARPTRQLGLRHRKKNGQWSYHVLVTNLPNAMLSQIANYPQAKPRVRQTAMWAVVYAYDRRGGGVETQNKGDKHGLGVGHRNKHRFTAQEMLVLLGQLAHNVVIWTRNDLAQVDPRLHKYGIQRTVRDALQIDGCVTVSREGQIQTIHLNERHPLAATFQSAFHDEM